MHIVQIKLNVYKVILIYYTEFNCNVYKLVGILN